MLSCLPQIQPSPACLTVLTWWHRGYSSPAMPQTARIFRRFPSTPLDLSTKDLADFAEMPEQAHLFSPKRQRAVLALTPPPVFSSSVASSSN